MYLSCILKYLSSPLVNRGEPVLHSNIYVKKRKPLHVQHTEERQERSSSGSIGPPTE